MTPEERILRTLTARGEARRPWEGVRGVIRDAITVKLTPEIIASVHGHATDEEALAAAFRAAGFIVEA